MLFWIAVAVLAAAVTYAVTRPMLRDAPVETSSADADIAVYKDQLREIDADAARGVIDASEADAARAEVSRRVLRRADMREQKLPTAGGGTIKPMYLATTLALPLLSLALYMSYGEPGLPGQPLQDRLAAPIAKSTTGDIVAKVEARLREHPEDGKGWDVIAPVYMAQSKYPDAANAYATAIKLLGETPSRLQGFADARIRAENGLVPDDARKALQSILAIDPKLKEPKIWLALAKEQDGKLVEAAADYRALIADASDTSPWRKMLQERLEQLDGTIASAKAEGAPVPGSPDKGPSAAEVDAAQSMTPDQRQAMILTMVGRLADRMKTDTKDTDGWLKLIRSYSMLRQPDDAAKAVASAKAGLAGDAAALAQIEALVKDLGIAAKN